MRYTADEIEAMRRRGEGRTDWDMSHEEAIRRRPAEAPLPYDGWEDSITVDLPQPKEQVTLRLDRDMLRWFRAHGRGYQTRINAVLRSYYLHEREKGILRRRSTWKRLQTKLAKLQLTVVGRMG